MQRRSFLKKATLGAAAGGATLAAPVFAQDAPTLNWRLASSFPRSADAIYSGGESLAKYVSEATGGKFSIRVFPAGEIVPALQVLDGVQNGTIECGHSASYYYFGKDPILSFDAAVPFGLNTRQMHAWMIQGNGLALTRVLFDKHNILNFPCGYTGAQMGGWFRPEIKTADDFRGLKVKAGGFARQVLARLGATPVDVAAPDAYTALEQGEVDAVAWIGPYDDEGLALYKVARNYYFPGWWAGTLQLSLYVNQDAYDELPKSYQSALELACRMASGNMLAKYDAGNPDALHRLVSRGAQLKAFPRPVLQACRDASLQLYDELGAKDPMFKKLYESMKSFRDKQAPWFRLAETSFDNLGLSLGPDASSG